MSHTPPRLYITTRDPRDGGGVATIARFVYEIASQAGYNPCLVANSLDRTDRIGPFDRLGWSPDEVVTRDRIEDLEVKLIPLILPQVEFTQYVLNYPAWRAAMADGDLYFAVGGTNLCTQPLVRMGVPFGSWVATLLWEDRIDRLRSAPVVERVRDRVSRPLLEVFERRGYQAANPCLVLSRHTAAAVAKKYDLDRERLDVVPYPIDTSTFTPDGPAQPVERPVVLFAGRLNDPRKNVRLLIEAFDQVAQSKPDAELWLIGADPDNALRAAIERAGVSTRIKTP
ncbi:MAG: glycosyltransferase, partial [Halobacteriales archaeon]|nr:glycosyltransferase [Halobacteriales archaeon]